MKTTKREQESSSSNFPFTQSSKKAKIGIASEYKGYKPSVSNESITIINLSDYDSKTFYNEFVKPKRPVVINGVIPGFQISDLRSENIVESLKIDEDEHYQVQIEKRVNGGFGSGLEKEKMGFDEFIDKVKIGKIDSYLTTQYDDPEEEVKDDYEDEEDEDFDEEIDEETKKALEQQLADDDSETEESIDMKNLKDDYFESDTDDNDEENDINELNNRILGLVQKPLTSYFLNKKIDVIPNILSTMIPQQINLWVGSGISNEEELNFNNIDLQKSDLGLGRRIPGNGTSSGLHHDHANNLYIPIQGEKRFTIFPPSEAENLYTVGDINKIYSSGVIDYEINEKAPNWKHVRSDGAVVEELEHEDSVKESEKFDPPSFSKIPSILLHTNELNSEDFNKLEELKLNHFPKLLKTKSICIHLKPNQMLYLPTGWFHEVTSFGDENNFHIAVNYWFYPPDGESFEKPYLDSFWEKDFEVTKKALDYYQEKKFYP